MNAHILIVEDNADYVDDLKDIVEKLGHVVRVARTLKEAAEAARGWVQVALIDVKLPDGDGVELAERLKEENPDCEAVLLTGHASVESAAKAVRADVWAYLVKPVAALELLSTLEKAVRQVQAHEERREAVRRAQMAERLAAVGRLTAGLSHEIRNPLNAASLQLSVLERRLKKLPTETREPLMGPLALVGDEIHRLERILHDFLHFARPTPSAPKPMELVSLLQSVTTLLAQQAETKKAKLRLAGEPAARVLGDTDQLRQVFLNLTLNALEAVNESGTVELAVERLSRRGNVVAVHVDDDGRGIADSARERLFEPFFTTKATGSGLGLSLCEAIVSQHGGLIVVGRSPLGGARFTVELTAAGPS